MLAIKYIEKNKEVVVKKLTQRQLSDAEERIDKLLALNRARKRAQEEVDRLASARKRQSAQAYQAKRANSALSADSSEHSYAEDKKAIKQAKERLKTYTEGVHDLLASLPNLPKEEVPIGQSAAENKVIKRWDGSTTSQEDQLRPHWDLLVDYPIIDFAKGVKTTGAGFPVYQKEGAKLQRALIQFFLEEAVAAGYQEKWLPLVVNKASAFGTGQLPDKDNTMYTLPGEGMYLIPTGEVPLTNLYRDTVLSADLLPIKEVAYTPCFRREAGSWGSHVRGLNRLHQFDKVEIVQITTPEASAAALGSMCTHIEGLLQALGLTYRILALCTADLGFASAQTYDFEVWAPGQKQWLEVSSVSTLETYQARRLHLQYQPKGKAKSYCHTLNGSALALPRVVAALLESYQTPTAITIPSVLHSYTGFTRIYPAEQRS